MKKTLFVIALAMMLVLSMASIALAKIAGSPAIAADSGFVAWPVPVTVAGGTSVANPAGGATIDTVNQAFGPHANYTTTTVKCAVCHSVHGAPDGSFLLTKATGVGAATSAAATCSFCHARTATASSKKVSLVMGYSTAPHGSRCSGATACHAQSPHGVGVSTYSLMASKLINKGVDTKIAAAIVDPKTGLTNADFTAGSADGFKVVTGYVCGQPGCHYESAFAVKSRGNAMMTDSNGGMTPAYKTGHPVIATAGVFSPPQGASIGAGKTVAWTATNGCDTCHDVADAGNGGLSWFPHNTPPKEAAQDVVNPSTNPGGALWMSIAANASSATTLQAGWLPADWVTDEDDYGSVLDGNCLKCHVQDANPTGNGVGKSF